jgi:hypothetical protein
VNQPFLTWQLLPSPYRQAKFPGDPVYRSDVETDYLSVGAHNSQLVLKLVCGKKQQAKNL